MQNLTDEEIMLKYQKGEALAMDEILRRYKNPIYHFILRLNRNFSEAQDIAQEVFLRVHQYRDTYRACGKFSTWIFSIAHHLFIDSIRKRKFLGIWPKKGSDSEEPMDFASPCPSPEMVVADNDMSGIVKKCIQCLPILQKEALVLREYHDLDYNEIAKILNKPSGTVKILIHRARLNLKEKLLPYIREFSGGIDE